MYNYTDRQRTAALSIRFSLTSCRPGVVCEHGLEHRQVAPQVSPPPAHNTKPQVSPSSPQYKTTGQLPPAHNTKPQVRPLQPTIQNQATLIIATDVGSVGCHAGLRHRETQFCSSCVMARITPEQLSAMQLSGHLPSSHNCQDIYH